jgi:hypothetical protein
MPLHERVVAVLQGSDRLSPVSKAGYAAQLTALLQQLTGQSLKHVLLDPQQTLHTLRTHRCRGTRRPMAASTIIKRVGGHRSGSAEIL